MSNVIQFGATKARREGTDTRWDDMVAARQALVLGIIRTGGNVNMEDLCRVADLWRVWQDSFTRERGTGD